jgi:hypothetical protein
MFPRIGFRGFSIKDNRGTLLDFLLREKFLLERGIAFNWEEPDHICAIMLPSSGDSKNSLNEFSDFKEVIGNISLTAIKDYDRYKLSYYGSTLIEK